MYTPRHFEETRTDVLHRLMRRHPFAALVTVVAGDVRIDHLPCLIETGSGALGTLHGHVARANPVWRELTGASEAVVIFQGPHAYISPSWYPSKAEHGRVVPTWNFAVVHARGRPTAIDDAGWVRAHLERLTAEHEARQPAPWRVTDAPDDFVQSLVGQVVGIEMPIASLTGKVKMSQNRSEADRLGAVAGLDALGETGAADVARMIEQSLEPR